MVQKWAFCVAILVVFLMTLQIQMALVRKNHSDSIKLSASTQCNVFEGKWVRDDAGYPLYKPGSCPFVEDSFSCSANGRPDSDFTHWRWQPNACQIPRFNGTDLLERMRGRRLVFVGDSLSRNQWESMLCLLREALANKSRVIEVNGRKITKDKGAFVFNFQDYNCHLEYYSSHFLVDEDYNTSGSSSSFTLRLDRVHNSHLHWRHADVLVFTTGHWWTHGKTAKGKNFYQEGNILHRKMNLMVAFTKAMQAWAAWVDKYAKLEKSTVFLSGYSPGHFRGGKWNSGGECQSATQPILNASQLPRYPEKMAVLEQTVRHVKFPVKLLNVTRLSSYRSDGHPSMYGLSSVHGYEDCSHWCLPGVPDVWNGLLYALLVMK